MTLTKYKDLQELFSGCVAYWDGSLNSSDALQNLFSTLHGTVSGAALTGTDKCGIVNNSLVFDGVNDYVALASDVIGDITSAFTIIAMVKITSTEGVIYAEALSSNTTNPCIAFRISSTRVMLYSRSNTNTELSVSYTTTIPIDTWIPVAITHAASSTTFTFYVNGIQYSGTQTFGSTSSTDVANIGVLRRGGSQYDLWWPGTLGELIIFNTQLSDVQLKVLADLIIRNRIFPLLPGVRCTL